MNRLLLENQYLSDPSVKQDLMITFGFGRGLGRDILCKDGFLSAVDGDFTDDGVVITQMATDGDELWPVNKPASDEIRFTAINKNGSLSSFNWNEGQCFIGAVVSEGEVPLAISGSSVHSFVEYGSTGAIVIPNGGSVRMYPDKTVSQYAILSRSISDIADRSDPYFANGIMVFNQETDVPGEDALYAFYSHRGEVYGFVPSSSTTAPSTTIQRPSSISAQKFMENVCVNVYKRLDGTMNIKRYTVEGAKLMVREYEYIPVGVFCFENPSEIDDDLVDVRAFDRMSKLDKSADYILSKITGNADGLYVLQTLFGELGYDNGQIASEYALRGKWGTSTVEVNLEQFKGKNMTCRELVNKLTMTLMPLSDYQGLPIRTFIHMSPGGMANVSTIDTMCRAAPDDIAANSLTIRTKMCSAPVQIEVSYFKDGKEETIRFKNNSRTGAKLSISDDIFIGCDLAKMNQWAECFFSLVDYPSVSFTKIGGGVGFDVGGIFNVYKDLYDNAFTNYFGGVLTDDSGNVLTGQLASYAFPVINKTIKWMGIELTDIESTENPVWE